ncbi:MAG: hypothetical protein JO235_02780 [Chroococcidiopsidaceae cyanobacterium CP_BM_RX_35]|nr:hypothetical protein [Chroococcidiopsidaceae cyanobacterium CP_BM_RX_35]
MTNEAEALGDNKLLHEDTLRRRNTQGNACEISDAADKGEAFSVALRWRLPPLRAAGQGSLVPTTSTQERKLKKRL